MRQSWAAWIRGDIDGAVAIYAPDAIWDPTHFHDWPERPYIGPEGMRRFMTEWLDVWDDSEAGVEDFVSVPDGRVLVLAWQRGKGRHSGLAMKSKTLTPTPEPRDTARAMSQENVEIVRRGVDAFSRAAWEESVELDGPRG